MSVWTLFLISFDWLNPMSIDASCASLLFSSTNLMGSQLISVQKLQEKK